MNDYRKAFLIVWLITGGVMLAGIMGSFVLGPVTGARFLPECEWQAQYGRACIACGLTTSFTQIARGDFAAARSSHRAGLPLYLLFAINSSGVLIYAAAKVKRHFAGE